MKVSTTHAKDGTEILEIIKDDNVYRMNSLYRPVAEAEKFVAQYSDMEEGSVLVVFGYGNGIFPKMIRKECSEKAKIIFYEPYKELSGKDCCRKEELPGLLEELVGYSNYEKVICCALPKYREIFPEEYSYVSEQIDYRIQRIKTNVATVAATGKQAVRNNVKNLKYFAESYCADSFINVFPKDMPVVIVAAGPSLEKNVTKLKAAKGKALIICVDAAIKYLLEAGIIPDFLVCVDQRITLSWFDDERIKGIPLICSPDTKHGVLKLLKDSPIIFASTENSYVQKLFEYAGHHIACLKSGGSVSTLAFSLCRYWGFQTIILIGQDLAFTGSKHHAGQAAVQINEANRSFMEVEDVNGEKVYTRRDYYSYLQWFEQMTALYSETEVIDATEGGARIKGSRIMTLEQALEQKAKSNYDMEAIISGVAPAFDEGQREYVRQVIQNSKTELNKLKMELESGIQFITKSLLNKDFRVKTDEKLAQICDYYNSLEEAFFIQREIDATELELFMSVFEGPQADSKKEQYERLKTYFEILLRATTAVSEIWDEMLITEA